MRILLNCLILLLVAATCAHAAETRGLRVIAKDSATGQQGEVKLYNKSYAVIIGIDAYPNLPPDRQLSYAVRDAKGIEEVLRKQYKFDKIVSLYNEQATRNRIVRLLTTELPREMGNEDALFIIWAGHGAQESSPDGEIGYLIPYDGVDDDISTAVTMSEIRDTISKKIPAKHVFYVMDACYSGLLTTRSVDAKSRRDLGYIREITKERVRQVLTAGGKGQEVLDGGQKGHSVFTGRLIEILEAAGDFITANEIQVILKEKVYKDAIGMGKSQTPSFGTLSGNGDFVFVPNLEQKAADSRAEVAKLERELKSLEAREAEARSREDARKQREIEAQRLAAEAKLKAGQLRQQQLQDEQRRMRDEEQDRLRQTEAEWQREQELATARTAEEQRLAALKAEVEKRRQSSGAARLNSPTIEAAVAEIRRLSSQVDAIDASYRKELDDGKQRITAWYDAEIRKLKQAKPQPHNRDEFETEEEFRQRVEQASSKSRIADLEKQQRLECFKLEQRIAAEQVAQTAGLRETIKSLGEKEYTLGAESLTLELGSYDITKQSFTVSIKGKIPSVTLASNGVLPLPRDAARQFKQQYSAGLVRPEVTVKAGSIEVVRVALANDAENYVLFYDNGVFLTDAEKKRRSLIYNDPDTGLQWVRDGNLAGKPMTWEKANSWVERLDFAGYHDWRMPAIEELEAFAKRGDKRPADYLNAHGFKKVQSSWYWSSTSYANYSGSAWIVDMWGGNMRDGKSNGYHYVWPVRAGR
jgi:hypothetical protein